MDMEEYDVYLYYETGDVVRGQQVMLDNDLGIFVSSRDRGTKQGC